MAGRTLLFTVPNAYRGAATADYYIYLPQNVKTSDAAQEKMGKMMDDIKKGLSPNEAYEKNTGIYGRFNEAARIIDPRQQSEAYLW